MHAAPVVRQKSVSSNLPTFVEVSRILAGALGGAAAGMILAGVVYGSLIVGLFAAMAGAAAGMVAATGERDTEAS